MFASHFVNDAAVFPPLHPRGGFGLQPSDDKPAEGRKAGLLATLRGLFGSQASSQLSSSRGYGR
jgi:hypothetical protein